MNTPLRQLRCSERNAKITETNYSSISTLSNPRCRGLREILLRKDMQCAILPLRAQTKGEYNSREACKKSRRIDLLILISYQKSTVLRVRVSMALQCDQTSLQLSEGCRYPMLRVEGGHCGRAESEHPGDQGFEEWEHWFTVSSAVFQSAEFVLNVFVSCLLMFVCSVSRRLSHSF